MFTNIEKNNFNVSNNNYIYKTNFFKNKLIDSKIKKFEVDFLPSILKKYNIIKKLYSKRFFQICNQYYFLSNNKIGLLIYFIHLVSQEVRYVFIQFDINDYEKIKEYLWRYDNHKIVHYTLNDNLKKIAMINLIDVLLDRQNREYSFKDGNCWNYSKNNIVFKNRINKISVKELNRINIKNDYTNHISLSKQRVYNMDEILKKYKILYKRKHDLGFIKEYYLEYNHNTVLLLLRNISKDCYYKIFFDKKYINEVRSRSWYVRDVTDKERHAKHLCYVASTSKTGGGLHRFLYFLEHPEDLSIVGVKVIDHINRNPLDNRVSNLRLVTITENNRNTGIRISNNSGYPGVRFNKQKNAWIAKRDFYYKGRHANPKSRALRAKSFEEAVKIRKKLEKITDDDFLSSKTTLELINSN